MASPAPNCGSYGLIQYSGALCRALVTRWGMCKGRAKKISYRRQKESKNSLIEALLLDNQRCIISCSLQQIHMPCCRPSILDQAAFRNTQLEKSRGFFEKLNSRHCLAVRAEHSILINADSVGFPPTTTFTGKCGITCSMTNFL